jgi:hypothetical protein
MEKMNKKEKYSFFAKNLEKSRFSRVNDSKSIDFTKNGPKIWILRKNVSKI